VIDGATNADAIPVLERVLQFAGQRHRLIVNNIANFDTPGYRPADVSVSAFRDQLSEAIDGRRAAGGTSGRRLEPADSRQVEFTPTGVIVHPEPIGANILFHDGNDRDLERTMQDLVENFLTFRMAAELLRNRLDLINTAIRERV
jgi:flagellar basal-body rod protein FlgB